jgi:integrase/recombinase XerD
VNKSKGFPKSQLNNERGEYGQSKEKSTPPPALPPLVEELFEKFIRDKRYLKNLSSKTIDSYREIFGRWVRFVGKEMPNVELLEKFVVGMREAGFTITTCNISIRSFNSFLSWLHDNGHAEEHFKIKQVPGGKRVMRTFRDEDLRRLLDWRPDPKSRNEVRPHGLIYLLVDTGVRIDEALKLRVDGVDLGNLLVKVRGKGNKERIVPISIEMRKVLYRYLDKHRQTVFPSDYLFCNSTGTPWSYQNACRELMKVCGELGIDLGGVDGCFHAFRRKFARNYVRQGGNVFYLQQVMGHSSLQTTRGYVTASEEDLREVHGRTGLLGRLSRDYKGGGPKGKD